MSDGQVPGLPWRSSGQDSALSLLGPRVRSLVRKLRSHMQYSSAEKTQQQPKSADLNVNFIKNSLTERSRIVFDSVSGCLSPTKLIHKFTIAQTYGGDFQSEGPVFVKDHPFHGEIMPPPLRVPDGLRFHNSLFCNLHSNPAQQAGITSFFKWKRI